MADNKRRGILWREVVELVLKIEGLDVARRPEPHSTVPSSDQNTDQLQVSDITGLKDWALLTKAEHQRDLSGNLDLAHEAAKADHKRWAAVAFTRNDKRESFDSFVVMSLRTFAQVCKALEARSAKSAGEVR